ncbi:hypothetical protein AAY473_035600, partial [Plecturocebus cupreus]
MAAGVLVTTSTFQAGGKERGEEMSTNSSFRFRRSPSNILESLGPPISKTCDLPDPITDHHYLTVRSLPTALYSVNFLISTPIGRGTQIPVGLDPITASHSVAQAGGQRDDLSAHCNLHPVFKQFLCLSLPTNSDYRLSLLDAVVQIPCYTRQLGAGDWGHGGQNAASSLTCPASCKEPRLEGLSFYHLDKVAICINGVPNRKDCTRSMAPASASAEGFRKLLIMVEEHRGLFLLPRLVCSGANMAHCSLYLLGSNDPSTSAFRSTVITGVSEDQVGNLAFYPQ